MPICNPILMPVDGENKKSLVNDEAF